jgi:hypothetical protein
MLNLDIIAGPAAGIVALASNDGLLNNQGIIKVLLGVGGIIIIITGASILGSARKADMAKTANTSLNTIIGMVFMAVGAGAVSVVAFGTKIANLLFG